MFFLFKALFILKRESTVDEYDELPVLEEESIIVDTEVPTKSHEPTLLEDLKLPTEKVVTNSLHKFYFSCVTICRHGNFLKLMHYEFVYLSKSFAI